MKGGKALKPMANESPPVMNLGMGRESPAAPKPHRAQIKRYPQVDPWDGLRRTFGIPAGEPIPPEILKSLTDGPNPIPEPRPVFPGMKNKPNKYPWEH